MVVNLPSRLDHLVLATPDVAETGAWLETATGVRPSKGGPHVGRGTHNELCSLGSTVYLEIIGPDPDQPAPVAPRPFGVDDVTEPVLVAWCARSDDIEGYVGRAGVAGVRYTEPESMSRRSPEGLLEWRLAFVESEDHGGIVPFVIDWGPTPHPAASAAPGLELVSFEAGHPDPDRVRSTLRALEFDLPIAESTKPHIRATIEGPAGRVELRA